MSSELPSSITCEPVQPVFFIEFKEAMYGILFVGITSGAYIVVYATSVYILLSKPGFTSSPPRMFMLGTTTFMFALGIIALVLVTTVGLQTLHSIIRDPPLSIETYYYALAWAIITCLMYILCDTICAWRTVVLWKNDKRVIGILGFFILGTIIAAGCSLGFGLIQGASPDNHDLSLGELHLILVGPTLATNLLSTGLIAWKAWQRRITVGIHLREGSRFVRVDRVFALLIESGLIYCCIWILYWTSKFGSFHSADFTVIAFVSGLYPTLIIILVSKQLSPVEHYSSQSIETQSTHVPALELPTHGGLPRHVPTIRRDSTSDYAQI